MRVVIIGAGDIGLYLASVFSRIHYSVVLIDQDPHKLQLVARELDIATRMGMGTDWELLEELLELSPDMLIALTNNDEANLVACTIAKNLGYPQTVARLRSPKYYQQSRLHFERLFYVDHVIGPERLTASAIANMVLVPHSISSESFSHGSVQLRTVKIPANWRKSTIPLKNREELELPDQVMVGLIYRSYGDDAKPKKHGEVIFPHGNTTLLPHDEATFIGETSKISGLHKFFGTPLRIPKSAVIIGGSLIGIYLAKALQEKGLRVRIIEKDFHKCKKLSEQLPYSTVIHRDGTDYKFLREERIGEADVFIGCTRNDEVNFLSASIARELGCPSTIISLSNMSFSPLLDHLGIGQAASPLLNAANRILSIAREKTIASMVSMYDNQAEIMEVKVTADSKIAGIPIRLLGPEFPKDFLIIMIQSRGRLFMADGDRILSPGDTVIVSSPPKHLNEIKKLF